MSLWFLSVLAQDTCCYGNRYGMKNNQSRNFRVLPQRKSSWFGFDGIFSLRSSCSQMAGGSGLEPKSNKAPISQPHCLSIRLPSSRPWGRTARARAGPGPRRRRGASWSPPSGPRRCPPDRAARLCCPREVQVQSIHAWRETNSAAPGVPAGEEVHGCSRAPHQPGADGASPKQGAVDVPLEENKTRVHF